MKKKGNHVVTPLGQNFENLSARWNVNYTQLQKLLGLGNGVIHTYRTRGSIPRLDKLENLENVTGIPLSRLIREVVPVEEFPPAPLTIYQARKTVDEPTPKYGQQPLIDATELAIKLIEMENRMRDMDRRIRVLEGK